MQIIMSGYAKISIHALLAESDCNLTQKKHPLTISIHALLAESDPGARHTGQQNAVYFYPRSPCGERPYSAAIRLAVLYFYPRSPCGERLLKRLLVEIIWLFLSTLSLRRATSYSQHVRRPSGNFYPRSPCGERPAPRGPL